MAHFGKMAFLVAVVADFIGRSALWSFRSMTSMAAHKALSTSCFRMRAISTIGPLAFGL
jgi:hypothetical protein